MTQQVFRAKDIAEMCQISESKAYTIIKQLNDELKARGFITFRGRVSKAYFMEKMYGMSNGEP